MCVFGPQTHAGDDRYSSGNWTPELIELDKASSAARDYAENNNGVGILIHVGNDIPNKHIKTGDDLGRLFVKRFADLGVRAKYFYRQNDTLATGITFHIGHLIHGAGDNEEVKILRDAWNAAPDVIEQLKVVKKLQTFKSGEN